MKLRYKILASLLTVGLASCSMLGSLDDLEIEYVQTDDTVISDAASAENLLAGIYTGWKTFGVSTFFANQTVRAGVMPFSQIVGSEEFEINILEETNQSLENFYTGMYFIINNANSFIAALEKAAPQDLAAERYDEMLGEAYFMKALSEYYLLCMFGEFYDLDSKYGIVLWNEPVRSNTPRARSSVRESYTTILEDLTRAETAPVAPALGHAGRYAVMALRAKVLLYMQDYAGAAEVAGDLIAENGYAMEDDFLLPFVNPYSSTENLFNLYCSYPSATQSNFYSNYYNNPGDTLTALADELVGEPDDGYFSEIDSGMYWDWLAEDANEQGMLDYFNAMYEEYFGPDYYGSVQDIIDEYMGYEMTEEEAREAVAQMIAEYAASVGADLTVEFNGSGYDYRFLQTYDPVLAQGENSMSKYIYNDWPETAGPSNSIFLLRMADVYYVKAEAEARQGSGHLAAARTALAAVLERAQYTEQDVTAMASTAEDLVPNIMKHRYMENFGENMDDYFDQVRALKIDGTNFCDNPLVGSGKTLIAPVPRAARAGNDLLEQLPKQ